MITWALTESGGEVAVVWNRRRKRFGSREEALKFIKENRRPEDRVVEIQDDGYTVPLTRRRWRRSGTDL